jgi:hypothetical protein
MAADTFANPDVTQRGKRLFSVSSVALRALRVTPFRIRSIWTGTRYPHTAAISSTVTPSRIRPTRTGSRYPRTAAISSTVTPSRIRPTRTGSRYPRTAAISSTVCGFRGPSRLAPSAVMR